VSQTAKIAVGNMADGNLDIFVIETDGALYHSRRFSDGSWSNFLSLGGSWNQNADIAVGNEKNGNEEVFIIGSSGNVYRSYQTVANSTSWSGWATLGGTFSQTVRTALGRNSDGRLELFTIGNDGTCVHAYETAPNSPTSWSGWTSLGGNWEADAKPVVSADLNGALEVFLIGTNGVMYHNYQSANNLSPNSWIGWLNLGGSFGDSIRACVGGTNNNAVLEVFLIGPDTDMLHAWQESPNSSAWSGWASLGGS
jgi:hypothetical protein